eukprot:2418195-Rhodomonas_salina.1
MTTLIATSTNTITGWEGGREGERERGREPPDALLSIAHGSACVRAEAAPSSLSVPNIAWRARSRIALDAVSGPS